MTNSKNTYILSTILFYWVLLPYTITAQSSPVNLMTDLLVHTEVVYKNGLLTNVPLSQAENSKDYQFAAIKSSYPRFGWIVVGEKPNTYQEAYRILLSNSFESVSKEKDIIWDSGFVDSNNSVSAIYTGTPLNPNTTYYWKVKTVTNTDGESDWSTIKSFRTAKQLSKYGASHYPLVKSIDKPHKINKINDQCIFIDFGKAAFGTIRVTLTAETDGKTVQIHLGEHQVDNRIDRKPSGAIRYHAYIQPLLKGTHTYLIQIKKDGRNTGPAAILMPDYIEEVLPFRYCEIEGYKHEISNNDITRESVHYPFDETQSFFQCDNDTLNQIWDLCKYSIKATSFAGIYVDGDRERIPYEADALINQLCHYGVDREYSMARRSHEYLLEYPTWPTEWIIQSVLIAWHDYMYTGDERSLKANYNILKKRTLESLKEKNGLISTRTGLLTKEVAKSVRFNGEIKDIVDWPHTGILGLNKHEGGEADGFVFTDYNSVVNAYHYEAIKTISKIAQVLGFSEDAKRYELESILLKERFLKSFFNKKKGYFTDGIETQHASLHSNMFPLAFDIVPYRDKQSVLDFIKTRGMACSVYGSQFLMDAIYDSYDATYGLKMLTKTDDRSWYNMIRVGSTISLEAWDNKYKPNQDWNHAWGAVPANIIPRKLIGLQPLLPGFSLASFKPQIETLSWVKSKVPTIRGSVDIEIKNETGLYEVNISIPANMEIEAYLPLFSKQYNISCNNDEIKVKIVKDEPFIYLGKFGSGTYTFKMKY